MTSGSTEVTKGVDHELFDVILSFTIRSLMSWLSPSATSSLDLRRPLREICQDFDKEQQFQNHSYRHCNLQREKSQQDKRHHRQCAMKGFDSSV
jgi:hypothetical protein